MRNAHWLQGRPGLSHSDALVRLLWVYAGPKSSQTLSVVRDS